jgi:branched-chain amino acid transport system substrate-binding protein
LSGDGLTQDLYKYAGIAATGTYFANHWHPEDLNPQSRQFVQAFEKENPKISDAVAALSYDAVMLLADAVKRANSIEPSHIRTALAETQGFRGVTGDITFDGNRNPINKSAVILKFEKGSTIYYRTVRP